MAESANSNLGRARQALSEMKVPCQILSHSSYGRKPEGIAPFFNIPKQNLLKTLTFLSPDGRAVLAILPKGREVDEAKLSKLAGIRPLRLAKAPEVLQLTGSEIGGVCPIGSPIRSIIDSPVIKEEKVLVSAGSPEVSIVLSGADLARASKALPGEISQ